MVIRVFSPLPLLLLNSFPVVFKVVELKYIHNDLVLREVRMYVFLCAFQVTWRELIAQCEIIQRLNGYMGNSTGSAPVNPTSATATLPLRNPALLARSLIRSGGRGTHGCHAGHRPVPTCVHLF